MSQAVSHQREEPHAKSHAIALKVFDPSDIHTITFHWTKPFMGPEEIKLKGKSFGKDKSNKEINQSKMQQIF